MPNLLVYLIKDEALIDALRPPLDSYPRCPYCQERITDVHPDLLCDSMINGEPAHEDCVFEALGELIETHLV